MGDVQLLQLVPIEMEADAARLADDALRAAGKAARRLVLRRPINQTMTLARARYGGAELIHAVGSGILGAVACGCPVVFTPNGVGGSLERRLVRMLRQRTELVAVAPSDWGRKELSRRKSAADWAGLQLIAPAGGLPTRRADRDEVMRRELGVSPQEKLVFAPGVAARDSGHDLALWSTSILEFALKGWRLIVRGDGRSMPRLIRFASQNDARTLIIGDDVLPRTTDEQFMRASDVVVSLGRGRTDVRPVLEARAMGVAVIVTATSAAAEFAEADMVLDEHSARTVARKLVDVVGQDRPAGPTWRDPADVWSELFAAIRAA